MLHNIQALRAFAAFIVALSHMTTLNPALASLKLGIFGVDIFFVISGFVMVYISERTNNSPSSFFANRLIRVAPLYWIMTLAAFCAAWLVPHLFKSTRADLAQLFQSLAFIPFMKGSGIIQPILFVGWTLNYEMFFYLLFAVSLAVPETGKRVILLSAAMVVLIAVGIMTVPQSVFGRFYTSAIMLEFVYGMLCGLAFRKLAGIPPLLGGMALAAGMIAIPLLSDLAFSNPFIRGFCALVIVLGVLVLETGGKTLQNRFIALIGAASYSLYLVHPFILLPIEKLAKHFDMAAGYVLPGVMAVSVVAMLAGAIVLHRVVEIPVTRFLRNRWATSRGGAAAGV